MNEHGEVTAISGEVASVRFRRNSMCGTCGACGMTRGVQEITVDVENTLGAAVGDIVDVRIEARRALRATAVAYLIPLAFLVAGVVAGWFIGRATALFDTPEVLAAICGIALCAASYGVLWFIDKRVGDRFKRAYVMTDIIEDDGKGESNCT